MSDILILRFDNRQFVPSSWSFLVFLGYLFWKDMIFPLLTFSTETLTSA